MGVNLKPLIFVNNSLSMMTENYTLAPSCITVTTPIISGGTLGQVLTKATSANNDMNWTTVVAPDLSASSYDILFNSLIEIVADASLVMSNLPNGWIDSFTDNSGINLTGSRITWAAGQVSKINTYIVSTKHNVVTAPTVVRGSFLMDTVSAGYAASNKVTSFITTDGGTNWQRLPLSEWNVTGRSFYEYTSTISPSALGTSLALKIVVTGDISGAAILKSWGMTWG